MEAPTHAVFAVQSCQTCLLAISSAGQEAVEQGRGTCIGIVQAKQYVLPTWIALAWF